MNLPLDSQIESLLFFKGEPVEIEKISSLLDVSEEEVTVALKSLEEKLTGRGLTLVFESKTVFLGTHKEASPLIEKITKEELTRDLGKAGLETLSIILYKGHVSRREIDYIRGVNSSFILRNLLIRGLVERGSGKEGERGYSYKPTAELLAFMGLSKIELLPEYEQVLKEIDDFSRKEELLKEEGGEQTQ